MAYISYSEFAERFQPELVRLGSADTIMEDDEKVIRELIEDASSEMNLDLAVLYDTDKLQTVRHKELKRICADITFYNLLKRKGIATYEYQEMYYSPAKNDLVMIAKRQKIIKGLFPFLLEKYRSPNVGYSFDREKFTEATMRDWEGIRD